MAEYMLRNTARSVNYQQQQFVSSNTVKCCWSQTVKKQTVRTYIFAGYLIYIPCNPLAAVMYCQ